MKRFLAIMFILALLGFGSWIGAQIEVTTSTVITIGSRAVDDTGTYVTPDSVNIVVYRQGVEAFDAWFNSADGECSELNSQLVFFDAFGDVDGDAGTGIYQISANFKESDDEYWVNTWYNLVDTTTQTYGSIIYWKADGIQDTTGVIFDTTIAILDTIQAGFGSRTAIGDTANQCDMVMVHGDATAAENLEDAFNCADTTAPIARLAVNQIWVYSDAIGGDEVGFFIHSDGNGFKVTSDNTGGVYIQGGSDGITIVGVADDGIEISGEGSGTHYDIELGMSETIHGTIDRCTFVDSTDTIIKQATKLTDIADTANAILDTIQAHAPHGDDWGQGAGSLTAITDTVNAILDTIQAHAPHGDDWSGSAGSNWSDAQRDSLLNTILDANKVNYMRWTAAQRDSVLNTILDANKVNFYNWTDAQRDSILNTVEDANKVNYMRWTAAQRDSVLNTILDANKANYKATNFATSTQGDSITGAIADANKINFKADTASVARSTWDNDVIAQASRTVNASCAGSGLRTVNIYVQNSADSSGLQSFTVSVDDSSSQTFIGRVATDSDGLTTWGLDDDTYEITFSAAGWSITSPVYLTVTADDDTFYYATQYSPTPPSATYCTVYTHTYKLTGAYSGCRLEARIPVEYGVVTSSTFLTVPYVVADTTEADGKVELNLVRSTLLTSSAGLTPVKVRLQLFDPDGNVVADTLMEIPDAASKKIW